MDNHKGQLFIGQFAKLHFLEFLYCHFLNIPLD